MSHSCSICKAFGHSLTRCNDNPDREVPQPKRPRHQLQNTNEKKGDKGDKERGTDQGTSQETEAMEKEQCENYLLNREMISFVVGKFMGCDVVMDEDQIVKEATNDDQKEDAGLADSNMVTTNVLMGCLTQKMIVEKTSLVYTNVEIYPPDTAR